MYTEKNQQWTYFGSLYFAYVSLLTIGYGDFYPQSNSGKPFFVFWSLLAVPTLTILISNMGDTLVKAVKDATIYIGEITVLPGEGAGVRDRLRNGLKMMTGGKLDSLTKRLRNSPDARIEDAPPGFGFHPGAEVPPDHPKHGDTEAVGAIADDFVEAEKASEKDAMDRGDKLAEDEHHYRHILISEIRKVYMDVNSPESKKYSYEEWAYYLKLLGEDERDAKFHRKPPVEVERPGDRLGNGSRVEEEQHMTGQSGGKENDAFAAKEHGEDESCDSAGVKKWSWVGNRSPLMGDKSEPEWILENLFRKLEEDLREQRKIGKMLRKRKESENRIEREEKREERTEDPRKISMSSSTDSSGNSSRPMTR